MKTEEKEEVVVPFPGARIAFGRKCEVCNGTITRPKRGPYPKTCSARCRKAKSRAK